MERVVGLKVDVDTHEGMKRGVPVLLSLCRQYRVQASFFVPMGKDHTGWTAKRVFTRRGFLKKASRVGVIETYGFKTLMYGLLLPGPEIARENPGLLRQIMVEGHEAGIHGYDHVYWHDHIKSLGSTRTEQEIEQAFSVYREITGEQPRSFAAPGWMINQHALQFFGEKGLVYSSDTRGRSPFFPVMAGKRMGLLQIPTTLPTLDEVVGTWGTDAATLSQRFSDMLTQGINILTVHTELEGKRWVGFLEAFIRKTLDHGFSFRRLIDIAENFRGKSDTPSYEVTYGHVEGRAGEVAVQGGQRD